MFLVGLYVIFETSSIDLVGQSLAIMAVEFGMLKIPKQKTYICPTTNITLKLICDLLTSSASDVIQVT